MRGCTCFNYQFFLYVQGSVYFLDIVHRGYGKPQSYREHFENYVQGPWALEDTKLTRLGSLL